MKEKAMVIRNVIQLFVCVCVCVCILAAYLIMFYFCVLVEVTIVSSYDQYFMYSHIL